MTATKRLRELLDERVVRWKRVRGHKDNGTSWHDVYGSYVEAVQEYAWDGGEFPEDKMVVRRGPAYMTPEQAIAATLGGGYQGFWTHDGTLHIELPKLPESILVRLPDKRDREVRSARVWQYTLGDADATGERHGVGTCHISVQDNLAETEGMGDVWLECDACNWQMPLEPSTPRLNFCPNCGKRVVE